MQTKLSSTWPMALENAVLGFSILWLRSVGWSWLFLAFPLAFFLASLILDLSRHAVSLRSVVLRVLAATAVGLAFAWTPAPW